MCTNAFLALKYTNFPPNWHWKLWTIRCDRQKYDIFYPLLLLLVRADGSNAMTSFFACLIVFSSSGADKYVYTLILRTLWKWFDERKKHTHQRKIEIVLFALFSVFVRRIVDGFKFWQMEYSLRVELILITCIYSYVDTQIYRPTSHGIYLVISTFHFFSYLFAPKKILHKIIVGSAKWHNSTGKKNRRSKAMLKKTHTHKSPNKKRAEKAYTNV